MTAILIAWAGSAAFLVLLAALLSKLVKMGSGWLGILVDTRGRFSLNRLQLVTWTLVILSLVAGVFFGRLFEGVKNPLGFTIPAEVLGLLGISVGTGVTAGAVKATKNMMARGRLATMATMNRNPFLGQIFLLEEGTYADKVIDVTKFQNFIFTIVLVVAYVAMAIHEIIRLKTAGMVTTLPALSGTFLVLLGISYAGYVGGKLPPQTGEPAPEAVEPRAGAVAREVEPPVVA